MNERFEEDVLARRLELELEEYGQEAPDRADLILARARAPFGPDERSTRGSHGATSRYLAAAVVLLGVGTTVAFGFIDGQSDPSAVGLSGEVVVASAPQDKPKKKQTVPQGKEAKAPKAKASPVQEIVDRSPPRKEVKKAPDQPALKPGDKLLELDGTLIRADRWNKAEFKLIQKAWKPLSVADRAKLIRGDLATVQFVNSMPKRSHPKHSADLSAAIMKMRQQLEALSRTGDLVKAKALTDSLEKGLVDVRREIWNQRQAKKAGK